ncbi:methionyl-tRNA synthetase family protein [Cryptosporidium andersoni]|uniref:methionine--tRNA ligase n=1 Tax=Cryptosporidium andersoni TaxID=117008 RepID=A0A1J4MM36_9CRYT|nr:methionyl-tRNA synthetase family protein [Cryptosporidium andersoni]
MTGESSKFTDNSNTDVKEWQNFDYNCGLNKPFYLTTAINYTNGVPHIGHAYEIIVSDAIVRIARIFGYNTRFMTGTDEHGLKNATVASNNNMTPKELCDLNVIKFKEMNNKLNISTDRFIRTTDKDHYKACEEIWKRCMDNGDIYLGIYTGWYSIKEETFVTELEAKMTNYLDSITGTPLVKMDEPSYFFHLTKYLPSVHAHILENPNFIQPELLRDNILSRLDNMQNPADLSISRITFSWGIPVPNDPQHVMYVWFDALTNYITGLNWPNEDDELWKTYWSNTIHIVGKDIVWFHCIIWPAMLMSANIPLPKTIFGHGFVTASDGKKMSKSLENVVDPLEQIELVGTDTFRYYICREGKFGYDFKFNTTSIVDYHNGELADSFGNLVSRTTNLAHKFCDGIVPTKLCNSKISKPFCPKSVLQRYGYSWNKYRLEECAQIPMHTCREVNKFLTDNAPWNKSNDLTDEDRIEIIRIVLESIYYLAHLMAPFTPNACEQISSRLGTPLTIIPLLDTDFNNLKQGTPLTIGNPLFIKISSKSRRVLENTSSNEEYKKVL